MRAEIQMIVQRALREGTFAMPELAKAAGLSYSALRAWGAGQRIPQADSLVKLADGLAKQAEKLKDLEEQVRRAAREE